MHCSQEMAKDEDGKLDNEQDVLDDATMDGTAEPVPLSTAGAVNQQDKGKRIASGGSNSKKGLAQARLGIGISLGLNVILCVTVLVTVTVCVTVSQSLLCVTVLVTVTVCVTVSQSQCLSLNQSLVSHTLPYPPPTHLPP